MMSNVNLNRLAVYVAVVDTGSLTAAAARLGVAKAAVSTHLQKLEAELGASLLVRTTRRLHLTPAGELFAQAARRIVSDAEAAVLAVGQDARALHGTLRVTAPVDYGGHVVAPAIVEMRRRHPKLKVELLTGDRRFDLVGEGIDVAIRMGRLADSSLRAMKIATFDEWLVASPDLVRGLSLKQPRDVTTLPFVALSVLSHPLRWTFEGPRQARQAIQFSASITANTAHAVRHAVMSGGGMAVLPDAIIQDDLSRGRMVRVLPNWKISGGGVFAVYPAARHRPQKVQIFVDLLAARLREAPKP